MGTQRGGQCPRVLLEDLLPPSSLSWEQKVLVSWEDAEGGCWARSFPLQAVTLPSTLLSIPSTWGRPSPCELWSSAIALHEARAPQPLAGKWQLVQQGVDVSLGLLGREQRNGEEPWLCLASRCLCCWLPSLGQGSRENMGCGTWLRMCHSPVRLRNSRVTKRSPAGSRCPAPLHWAAQLWLLPALLSPRGFWFLRIPLLCAVVLLEIPPRITGREQQLGRAVT